jgi:predicted N-acetyltransferase YhbS
MKQNLQGRATRVDVALRPLRASDLTAIHRLVQEAGWPHRIEDCAMLLDLGGGMIVVGAGNQPIGTGMFWSFGRAVAALGMILVSPEHQGRGVGRAIMEALMHAAGPRALMLHATLEGMPLYEKLGFHSVGAVRQHQGRLIPVLAPLPASPTCVRRAVATDQDAIHLLDERAFGAKRSALLTRLTNLGKTWVAEENKRLTGFAIRRAFGRGEIIGPVVARNEE